MSKNMCIVFVSMLSIFMVAFVAQAYTVEKELQELQSGKVGGRWKKVAIQEDVTTDRYLSTVLEETEEPEETTKPTKKIKNEYEGFVVYNIPDDYKRAGAKLQKKYQKYLWKLCKKRGLNYYILLAMIEQESGYDYSSISDNGDSVGYLQIQEKWHSNIMKSLGVNNLQDPKGNLNVGTKLLQNIYKDYGSSGDHCVLMVYNMGATGAKKLWKKDIYSTKYSRKIMKRAKQIEQELTQDIKG